MSSTPKETETYDVALTREQQWIVHDQVVTLADETLEKNSRPPAWLVDLFERIEDGSPTITEMQVAKLQTVLAEYVADPETPAADERVATSVLEELPAIED